MITGAILRELPNNSGSLPRCYFRVGQDHPFVVVDSAANTDDVKAVTHIRHPTPRVILTVQIQTVRHIGLYTCRPGSAATFSACDAGHVVVLGNPELLVVPALSAVREIQRVAESLSRITTPN